MRSESRLLRFSGGILFIPSKEPRTSLGDFGNGPERVLDEFNAALASFPRPATVRVRKPA